MRLHWWNDTVAYFMGSFKEHMDTLLRKCAPPNLKPNAFPATAESVYYVGHWMCSLHWRENMMGNSLWDPGKSRSIPILQDMEMKMQAFKIRVGFRSILTKSSHVRPAEWNNYLLARLWYMGSCYQNFPYSWTFAFIYVAVSILRLHLLAICYKSVHFLFFR